jgi:uncharacterized membrane protein
MTRPVVSGTIAAVTMAIALLAALVDLSGKTTVLKVGWFEITLANLIVFVLLIAVCVAALVVPLPGRRARDGR